MKPKSIIKHICLTLFLGVLSCNKSIPQSREEIKKIELDTKKENLRTLFLGAINFCSDTEYSKFLDNPRSKEEYKNGGNCCTSSVPSPYINLSEYFIYAMEGDRSIFDNQNNPFKLREVRKKWEVKVNKIRKEAESVEPNNLIYKGFRSSNVTTYDLNSGQLKFGLGYMVLVTFDGLQGNWDGKINFRYKGGKNPIIQGFEIALDEAEKLFRYYEDNDSRAGLPQQKKLNTIITYSLEKPDRNDRLSMLIVDVKKVEFFHPNGWDKKLGEVTL